jgi:hypothetical protein
MMEETSFYRIIINIATEKILLINPKQFKIPQKEKLLKACQKLDT